MKKEVGTCIAVCFFIRCDVCIYCARILLYFNLLYFNSHNPMDSINFNADNVDYFNADNVDYRLLSSVF